MKVKFLLIIVLTLLFSISVLAQENTNSGWIKVYFNMPSDTSVMAEGNKANDSWDLISTLENLIDSAKFSIDLSIYDIEHERIAYALVKAKKRGVRVRVVTDNHNRTDGGVLDEKIWERDFSF